jgi:hypothetical protein
MHSYELRRHAIRPWKILFVAMNAGYVKRFQVHQLHLQARCSQPSGEVRCDWMWHFRKHASSTFQCKLNAGLFFHEVEFRLSIHQMCVCFFVPCIFMIRTSYSNFQGIINPWHFKIGPVFIWTFFVTKPRILSPTFMSKPHESPCISA